MTLYLCFRDVFTRASSMREKQPCDLLHHHLLFKTLFPLPRPVVTHAASYVFPAGSAYVKRAVGHRGVRFTVKRKNLPLGKAKPPSVCVCVQRYVNWWVLWGGHLWPSSAQALACLCIFIKYAVVFDRVKWWTPWGAHLRLSYTRPPTLCVCKYQCVWVMDALRWSPMSSLSSSSMSPAGKQVPWNHGERERGRESTRRKKPCSSCQSEVFTQQRLWHASERHKHCRRCKWKVTLWGFAPLSILIAKPVGISV